MPKISKILKIFFPLVLASIAIFICFKNYTPGTYLIGWDSIHPEFNFSLNAKRMFSHVWASERGVGAISAHSDMSDLPRIILLWIASIAVPVSFLRYFYIFSCLIIGPLGVYFFLKYIFQREKDSPWVYPASFLGGLFYLLNLGTLQNFYVPLEMFTVAFAGVPWLFLTGIKALRSMTRSNLVKFALVVVLIAPMAYAATQAYVIYFGLFLFLFVFALISSGKKLKLKRLLVLGIVAILLNIYWILPNIYSVLQQPLTISNANINRLFSQESFLRNADYGNLANVAIQKGFLFSWRNFDFAMGKFDDLLNVWNVYLINPGVLVTGYALALLALVGILLGVFKRDRVSLAFLLPLALCLFFLFNVNPPAGKIYEYLYSHFGVFREGFRTPFTKFSVLFGFILSFYFGYFCYRIFTVKIKYLAFFKLLAIFWLTGAIVIFSFPVFLGEMIGKNVRVVFPKEYEELFDWFSDHAEGRVALMPINTKFGWEYRNWDLPAGRQGYEGSGFLTYGIPNPIFYRDFDRWNSSNEDFYSEAAFALYANDTQSFISTLKKYQVKYMLLDESITNAGSSDSVLKIAEIKNIAEKAGWSKTANFGFLSVYDTGISSEILQIPETYSKINANTSYSPVDPVYQRNGDYVEGGSLIYPFISLDKRSGIEIAVENGILEFKNTKFDVSLSLSATESSKPDLSINQGFDTAYNCDLKKIGNVSKEINPNGILYKAESGGVSCDYISFPDLRYSQGYVLHITGRNISGRSLKIYLFDSKTQLPYMEEILPAGEFDETYFVYPREIEGEGYILNLETRSFGRVSSENLLTDVEFIPVDYAYLASYQTGASGIPEPIQNNLRVQDVKKYGTWAYRIQVEMGDRDRDGDREGEGLFMLGQGYESGWIAFPAFDLNLKSLSQISRLELLSHVKVNSWSNAWEVDFVNCRNDNSLIIGNCKLLIVFWPQFLEWFGLLVGGFTFLVLVLPSRKK